MNIEVSREQDKKIRKVDNLINIVENHTRTERHLEQYSHIGDPVYKEMARDKQDVREKQIDELKNQLVGNDNKIFTPIEQLEMVKNNYEFSEEYINNNREHMNVEDLSNLERKQQNRRTQIENLEENRRND